MRINIFFHSIHGHSYRMAQEIERGIREIEGIETSLYRVPETLSEDILASMGAADSLQQFSHIPVASLDNLEEADGIVLGAPTYFGTPSCQMVSFLHGAGPQWAQGTLIGKVGTSFTTSSEQNGGAETCLHTLNDFFYHQGMIIVPMPTALTVEEMHEENIPVGGYAYGASMITGGLNDREITPQEAAIARLQGRQMGQTTRDLVRGREVD